MDAMLMVKAIAKWVGVIISVLVLTVYFLRAFDSRNMQQLGPEYRVVFEHEFDASQEQDTNWSDYLAIEDQLAIELLEKIDGSNRAESVTDRHAPNSLTDPDSYHDNWNHSYEITARPQKGVAVLLHGLTDSPYSMLATAQALAGAGYSVVVPRMPGHGFAVGGLLQARSEDWAAAVRIAVGRAAERSNDGEPLLLAGYSNGALMAIDYSLQCDEYTDLPCPDSLMLMSPAIAITKLAIISNWHAAVSWLPYFEQFKWSTILPEVDPFKFTSFPKRAAWEIYNLSKQTHTRLQQPGEAEKLPPILTFQSLVDNTVTASAIVTLLYDKLAENGSELVVYDINRNSTLLSLMKSPPIDPIQYFQNAAPARYSVTILHNRNPNTVAIDVMGLHAGLTEWTAETTKLRWPKGVYSLSHIAIPFAANDEVYGDGSGMRDKEGRVIFGALAPRGERGVLELTPDYFLRARHNPFFAYQAMHLSQWLESL
jgi:alpha-beta hydrolase superfamily lysophospholipase